MAGTKPNCRWWDADDGFSNRVFFAECNDIDIPLVGAQAAVAQAIERDTGAYYCPWCGGDIVYCEEGEVANDYAADEESRAEVRRMQL